MDSVGRFGVFRVRIYRRSFAATRAGTKKEEVNCDDRNQDNQDYRVRRENERWLQSRMCVLNGWVVANCGIENGTGMAVSINGLLFHDGSVILQDRWINFLVVIRHGTDLDSNRNVVTQCFGTERKRCQGHASNQLRLGRLAFRGRQRRG